jgi:hypothetical protein
VNGDCVARLNDYFKSFSHAGGTMEHQPTIPLTRRMILLSPLLISGCDDRATRIALEAADRQAEQNVVMSQLNREVAAGAQHLVTADAEARGEVLKMHHDLQSAHSGLAADRSALETERQRYVSLQRLESIFTPSIKSVGSVIVVITLLGFSWHLLAAQPKSSGVDAELSEFLVTELLKNPHQCLPDTGSPLSLSDKSESRTLGSS